MSDSCQSSSSMITTMPTKRTDRRCALSAPEANSSLMASTSLVTRVTSRPTGLRSKKPSSQAVQESEHVRAQVGHRARAGDLHRVHLQERQRLLDQHDITDSKSQPAAHHRSVDRWRSTPRR